MTTHITAIGLANQFMRSFFGGGDIWIFRYEGELWAGNPYAAAMVPPVIKERFDDLEIGPKYSYSSAGKVTLTKGEYHDIMDQVTWTDLIERYLGDIPLTRSERLFIDPGEEGPEALGQYRALEGNLGRGPEVITLSSEFIDVWPQATTFRTSGEWKPVLMDDPSGNLVGLAMPYRGRTEVKLCACCHGKGWEPVWA